MAKLTPMMEQYIQIKNEYKDAFLFYRLGDFYELFYEDATRAAQELEITLTKRAGGKGDPIPMCGVPYHSAENYIKTLIDRGYKVAICEQVEDPKTAKGVVKREVVQMITPGTVMESTMLTDGENNYIGSLSHFQDGSYVIVYNDLSTGENRLALINDGWDAVIHEFYNQPIKEIVISSNLPEEMQLQLKERLNVTLSYQDEVTFNAEFRELSENLNDERLMKAFSRLLNYIQTTQKRSLHHLQKAEVIELKQYMSLDMYSKRNLELTETIMKKSKHGSLLWVLDKTVTAMGARTLKKWLERPLLSKQKINERLEVVQGFYDGFMERESLRDLLKSVYDLERLSGRIAFGNVNARDLIQLKQSLSRIPALQETLKQFDQPEITRLAELLIYPEQMVESLEMSIVDEPPISIKEGSLIKEGYHDQLDTYRDASRNGKKWIAQLEHREREETGIRSLKVGYNRVFGYYIEITKPNLHLLPEGRYERKQTLTNAERFVNEELKEKEKLILEAEEKSVELEYDLFIQIRDQIKEEIPLIQQLAHIISQIDVLQSFASVSESNNYVRPEFNDEQLQVTKGRHPVVEQVMKDGTFVPNDVVFDKLQNMLLITGPNMSGKSTYMRQVALTAIMGQIGCFIPAEQATLCIFDQIFTRIGAADDLVSGQSTFMVEMLEARHAISNATDRSLILLDEIGRGTSTYDGMALAQAIVEYIHNNIAAKTLFSTHYHELTALEDSLHHLKNIHVRAQEHEGNVIFLHQIKEGAADQSYGIHVAKLAELPSELIERASVILEELEDDSNKKLTPIKDKLESGQLSFFVEESNKKIAEMPKQDKLHNNQEQSVIEELKNVNVLDLTPLEAMNELYRLQKGLKQ
ncbi:MULTISPECIES: DNA mismatch repair protein MutS [unclassified Oceanobacillus]|uniref:DNA mismatch repair protein MutS n=1 Tax=Oceanobacillus TaxID=182709 RepID=UPI001BE97D51|nr:MULTISPECIES: DNA mismatch repair protein MutS [unclassified Oceanobacillus]MBT2598633.1 DNA mismatch repair protein MutS [Oceanobacillus sp. ISL-74]MBT2651552.1 DNA mismatch repair protein MutS [Oceanobacillus sp. ISL-73]